jgi:hypothetical protein
MAMPFPRYLRDTLSSRLQRNADHPSTRPPWPASAKSTNVCRRGGIGHFGR